MTYDYTPPAGQAQAAVAPYLLGVPIQLASAPYGVAANPVTNRIYVTSGTANTVTVIDGIANALIGTPISLGQSGSSNAGIAVDHTTNRIYVANTSSDTVQVIDGGGSGNGGAGTVIGNGITVGSNPLGVAVDPTTHRVYVTNALDNTVSVIQGSVNGTGGAGSVVGSPIQVGPRQLSDMMGVAVNPYGQRVYVTCGDNNTVTVIDGKTASIVQVIDIGASPKGIAVNPTSGFVYVGHDGPTAVSVLGTPFLQESAIGDTITVETFPWGVAVNPRTNRVYVANSNSGSISVIDGAGAANRGAGSVVGSAISVGAKSRSVSVALNPNTNRVYVANQGADSVTVINGGGSGNGGAGSIIGTPISVGQSPWDLSVNPTTNRVYVANAGSDSVSVIDGVTNRLVGSAISVGDAPFGVAVNPATNRVYVTNSRDNTVSVLGPTFSVTLNGIRVTSVPPGSTVQVTWGALFGTHASDRVGLFQAGATGNGSPFVVRYTNNRQSPSGVGVSAGTVDLPIPTSQAPGNYEIRLVSGHNDRTLASIALTIA